MRQLIIENPISGTGADKYAIALEARQVLTRAGHSVDIALTERAGHATELAAQAVRDGYEAVIACGGDGTVNETARSLCGTQTALGIIPAGSGNGLARHIGMPMNAAQAVQVLAQGHTDVCDYGTVNDREFFCTFGVGFDAAVSDRFAAAHSRGLLTYLRATLQELLRYRPKPYRVTVDGHSFDIEAFILTGANASQYGNNAYISPLSSIKDGQLELVIVHKLPILALPFFGLDMMTGTLSSNRHITVIPCREATIERPDDGAAHIDGEPCRLGRRLEVRIHPSSLRILTPAGANASFEPLLTPLGSLLQ